MKYDNFPDMGKVSKLGFGAMRFPKIGEEIDQAQVDSMIKIAYDAGVTYFDTAYVYGEGASERALGKALKQFPRDSYFLADKLPYYRIKNASDCNTFFNESLTRCGVDYFDYYLIHAVNAKEAPMIDEFDVVKWAVQKQKEGKIRKLGFSMHDSYELLVDLLGKHKWDFVQIQYNYMDIVHEPGKAGFDELKRRGIPVVIMEPLKGGILADIPEELTVPYKELGGSNVSYGFRWLNDQEGIMCILSGMSNITQTEQNCEIFSNLKPLTDAEKKAITQVSENILSRQKVGCTACAYCMPCPVGIDIPGTFKAWNTKSLNQSSNWISGTGIEYDTLAKCVECGKCAAHCPQKLSVPMLLKQVIKEK